jgi:hypothetical protein
MFEELGGIAVALRVDGPNPYLIERRKVAATVDAMLRAAAPAWTVMIRPTGWFVCAPHGVRETLAIAAAIETGLMELAPTLEADFGPRVSIRWGLWVDRFVAPYDPRSGVELTEIAWARIFDFEPANATMHAERIYEQARRWYEFARHSVRRYERRPDDGYTLVARKRPSALDHLSVAPASPYVGRAHDLAFLDELLHARADAPSRVAVVGPPGAGKTRLVAEWRRRHPGAHVLSATFSVFGADLTSFAEQLVELGDRNESVVELVARIGARIDRERVDVLVLDDLHWAGEDAPAFLGLLCSTLSRHGLLLVLCSRPSGKRIVDELAPTATLALPPLPRADLEQMGRDLALDPNTAARAAAHADGNPLFVEQFAAWYREAKPSREQGLATTLRDVIAGRLDHLRTARLEPLRDYGRNGAPRSGETIARELATVEAEVGRWLDRLESGDYADGPETYRYLVTLQAIDRTLFAIRALRGGGIRPPSNRLQEAIERILIGNPAPILEHLTVERARARGADLDFFRRVRDAGIVAYSGHAWEAARGFLQLAVDTAPAEEKAAIVDALARCRRRLDTDAASAYFDQPTNEKLLHGLTLDAAVNAAQLPEIWLALAMESGRPEYYRRAMDAAAAVGDAPVGALAEAYFRFPPTRSARGTGLESHGSIRDGSPSG